jgi:hypothetical protein
VSDVTTKMPCSVCAEFNRQILAVMREHLKAESELANAVFVLQDFSAAREADARANCKLEEHRNLRIRFEDHLNAEHRNCAVNPLLANG